MTATLTPGRYQLVAYARRVATGSSKRTMSPRLPFQSAPHKSTSIADGAGCVSKLCRQRLGSGYRCDNWRGIDAVHLGRIRTRVRRASVFLGSTTQARRRDDVAAVFGQQFLMSGFEVSTSALPPGRYLVAVFGRSTVTGRFDGV